MPPAHYRDFPRARYRKPDKCLQTEAYSTILRLSRASSIFAFSPMDQITK
jgi:hypothetical protein